MGGCLIFGLAAVLSLAIPASVARASLVGAYVVIAALAAAAVAAFVWNFRRRRAGGATPRLATALTRIGVVAVVYAAAVTVIHFA